MGAFLLMSSSRKLLSIQKYIPYTLQAYKIFSKGIAAESKENVATSTSTILHIYCIPSGIVSHKVHIIDILQSTVIEPPRVLANT